LLNGKGLKNLQEKALFNKFDSLTPTPIVLSYPKNPILNIVTLLLQKKKPVLMSGCFFVFRILVIASN